jgi:hypothetical protein
VKGGRTAHETGEIKMTLYTYATAEAIRNLTATEVEAYEAFLATDSSHTGAVDGAMFGMPGVTVYAA